MNGQGQDSELRTPYDPDAALRDALERQSAAARDAARWRGVAEACLGELNRLEAERDFLVAGVRNAKLSDRMLDRIGVGPIHDGIVDEFTELRRWIMGDRP